MSNTNSSRTQEIVRYRSVLLNGARDALTEFAIELRRAGYGVGRPNQNVLCVDNVTHEELFLIKSEAADRDCFVESVRGKRIETITATIKKAKGDLDVEQGKWYFAENMEDSYPFVLVRAKYTETVAGSNPDENGFEDEEFIVVELELLGEDGYTPNKIKAHLSELADFGLRAATEEDFDDRDLPVPAELHFATKKKELEEEEEDEDDENEDEDEDSPKKANLAYFKGF